MHDQPEAPDMLAIARQTLLDKLLPQLSAAQRYEALMIASAMQMASREQAAGHDVAEARQRLQRALLGTDAPADSLAADRALAAALRNGALDGRLDELQNLLREDIAARLAISNPKQLQKLDG
ncbi:DUF6285 domain-containing protein [Pseudomonas lopnurensis]|uniref:DUF6285 domain-containing protein n=1 Tax=Pseudomonas lopnurensis TaxID=1477517 RepID=UPI0028AB25EB|nr:DUF6285 domain-containing protein [Pseudomonas lopnurensis]